MARRESQRERCSFLSSSFSGGPRHAQVPADLSAIVLDCGAISKISSSTSASEALANPSWRMLQAASVRELGTETCG